MSAAATLLIRVDEHGHLCSMRAGIDIAASGSTSREKLGRLDIHLDGDFTLIPDALRKLLHVFKEGVIVSG